MLNLLRNKPTPTFFAVLRESPPLHLHMIQAVTFFYVAWRFASRNFATYGYLPADIFSYPRTPPFAEFPVMHFSTFQFIYDWVPHPSASTIEGLQWVIILSALAGMIGLFPRLCAGICFVLGSHLIGFVQSSNAEIEGHTLVIMTLAILMLTPRGALYNLSRKLPRPPVSTAYHWPVFLFLLFTAMFYTQSGINKLQDVGPHWPFILDIHKLAAQSLEGSLFLANRFYDPATCHAHLHPSISPVAGLISLVGEVGFISILWFPRSRWFYVLSMATLHILVFFMAGINFAGSSLLLILCLDWNSLVRGGELILPETPGQNRVSALLARADRRQRIRVRREGTELVFRDDNGDVWHGVRALEQALIRLPRSTIPAWLMRLLPGFSGAYTRYLLKPARLE